MNKMRASVEATPSKQFKSPLKVTRVKPSYAAFTGKKERKKERKKSLLIVVTVKFNGADVWVKDVQSL